MNEQLREALAALKSGQKKRAYRLAGQVIRSESDPKSLELAWMLMSATVSDPARKKRCYEAVLLINPDNSVAQKELAKLEAQQQEEVADAIPAAEEAAPPPQPAPSRPVAAPRERLRPQKTATGEGFQARLQEVASSFYRPPAEAASAPRPLETVPLSSVQILGIIGGFLLALGVFMPLIRIPIAGSMNYFQAGRGDGSSILVVTIVSVLVVLLRRYNWLWVTVLPTLTLILSTLLLFIRLINELGQAVEEEMQDNLFGGLATLLVEQVQIEWGWLLLITGCLLLLGTGALGRHGNWSKFAVAGGGLSLLLLIVLFAVRGADLELEELSSTGSGGTGRAVRVDEGEPARYDAGELRVLQMHDPAAFYVVDPLSFGQEPAERPRGTEFVAVEIAFACSETTEVVCDTVPEATLALRLADGREVEDDWSISDAPEPDEEDIGGGERATGWVAFRVPAESELDALLVEPFGSGPTFEIPLPAAQDGYRADHSPFEAGDSTVRLLAPLRRRLRAAGYETPLTHRFESGSDAWIQVNVCEETDIYFDEEEALQGHRQTVLDVAGMAAGNLRGGEFLLIAMEGCASTFGTEIVVLFESSEVMRWTTREWSDARFLQSAYVSLE